MAEQDRRARLSVLLSVWLGLFNLHDFFCCCSHNPQPVIVHTIQQNIKLTALGVLSCGLLQKELVNGYVVTQY